MTRATTPQAILEAALGFRDRRQFDEVAALCDPISAESLFRAYCDAVRPPTVDDYRREYPHLSEESLQARFATRVPADERRESQIAEAVPGVSTYAELSALAPMDFLRRWLEGEDPSYQTAQWFRKRGRPVPQSLAETPAGVRYEMLPPEQIADGKVRVPYRIVSERDDRVNAEGSPVQFETLRRTEQREWRLLVRHHLLQPRGATMEVLPRDVTDLMRDDS
jgi:hypothetical protein